MFASLLEHPLKMRGSLRLEKKKVLFLSSTTSSSPGRSLSPLFGEQASAPPRRPLRQTEDRSSSSPSFSAPAIHTPVTVTSSTWCLSRGCVCKAPSTSSLCTSLFPVLESRRYTTLMRKLSRFKEAGNRQGFSREKVSQSHFTLLPCRRDISQPLLQSVFFFSSTAGSSPSSSSHLHRLPQNSPKRHASPSPSPPPPRRMPVLSIEEALYMAKEANVYTVKELQQLVMQSPSFSPSYDPFLLENFFTSQSCTPSPSSLHEVEESLRAEEEALVSNEESSNRDDSLGIGETERGGRGETDECFTGGDAVAGVIGQSSLHAASTKASTLLENAVISAFSGVEKTKTFYHNGKLWLWQAEGRGTRKRAVAHVLIRRGTGQVRVNKDEDLYVRWPLYYNRMDVLQPFLLTQTAGIYDVFIHTRGGGSSGQAGATRLAVGRALVNACAACADLLTEAGVLYEDTRQRMPKMPGRMKARKMRTWSKR